MKPPGHVMILASAGSGKTYALTGRFVQLLAAGVPPERIVALTFTRKAAGEFFDEILNKLAAAAREEKRAARLARETGSPGLDRAGCLRLLRATVDAMHRLSLGTFDSFFARLVRSFPLELGLVGDFTILSEHAVGTERRRAQRRLFSGSDAPSEAQRDFIEAFKRATFGVEEKRLGDRLDDFIDRHQDLYLAAPDSRAWGDPGRIWPEGCAWLKSAGDRGAAAAALRDALPWGAMSDGQRARWDDFLAALDAWTPGAPLPKPVDYILKNALEVREDLARGAAEMTVERRRLALDPSACAALRAVLAAIVGAELARRLEVTRGIHAVLEGYEACYHELVRRAGRLTFADVQRLLEPEAGAPLLSGRGTGAPGGARLLIDFRLDARFEHWLLDEFQDTSFGQWSVLRNLIDEAVQDSAGNRSFFYVGDVKQAIFTWRGGEPRLFREIFDHYNRAAPGTIREQRLDHSFRSGPPVIEAVNRVFGAADTLRRLFPAQAAEAWNREWREHVSNRPEIAGQAALLEAEDEAGRFARTLEILGEVRPLERGLTCAVLVRTNAAGARLADYLRREGGIPALAESDERICTDNPLGAALLALFKAAAHPGDTLAWEHLRMTPLGELLESEGLADRDAFTLGVLGELHRDGFERTVEAWLRRLEPRLEPDDAFTRDRGVRFAAAARLFDESGSRDAMEFIRFMEAYTEREGEAAAAVRVMTVHKAKGLGFDVVIAPDLQGERLDQRPGGLAVQRRRDRSVAWILDLPPKRLWEADEVLSAHAAAAAADACYEEFSVLYVAMTRAKRALYMIVEPPGKSQSANFPLLLSETMGRTPAAVSVGRLTLAGLFSAGDPRWFEGLPLAEAPARAEAAGIPAEGFSGAAVRRLRARRPSERKVGRIPATGLFSLRAEADADFGTEVHRELAAVEWWDGKDAGAWAAERRRAGASPGAVDEALACLTAPALAAVFARPGPHAEVWRERPFEIALDGDWITGVFDRVVIERGEGGEARRVIVFDFKTDRIPDGGSLDEAAGRHAAQIETYRRAAAVLTGARPAGVECRLVFTRCRRAALLPRDAPASG